MVGVSTMDYGGQRCGRLDAQDGRGCACTLGRGLPHRRPADPS